ncbi:MAG: hypothetical protein ACFFA8_01810 [Promethearchaeota archaeon]
MLDLEVAEAKVEEFENPSDILKIIPNFNVKSKEKLGFYFDLLLKGSPQLKFSINDKKGNEIYANLLSVEMQ